MGPAWGSDIDHPQGTGDHHPHMEYYCTTTLKGPHVISPHDPPQHRQQSADHGHHHLQASTGNSRLLIHHDPPGLSEISPGQQGRISSSTTTAPNNFTDSKNSRSSCSSITTSYVVPTNLRGGRAKNYSYTYTLPPPPPPPPPSQHHQQSVNHGPQCMHFINLQEEEQLGSSPTVANSSSSSSSSSSCSSFGLPPSSSSSSLSIQPPSSPVATILSLNNPISCCCEPMFSTSSSHSKPASQPMSGSFPLSFPQLGSVADTNSRPSTPASQPLDGARLMALLTTQSGAGGTESGLGGSGGGGGEEEEEETLIGGSQFGVTTTAPHLLAAGGSRSRLISPAALISMHYGSGMMSSGMMSGGMDSSSGGGGGGHGHGHGHPPAPAMSPALPSAPPVNLAPTPSPSPGRPPPKVLRGRHLRGDHIGYDVDVRKLGEAQPQLEVSPITKYTSEQVFVLGRQIAVNKKFICYGLRGGTIRILNIDSAQKALLRGHTKRVTDMAFLSENTHLLASASQDGRVYVRKIVEGHGVHGKLTEHILLAIQFNGDDWDTCHPRLCWQSRMQDFLVVAVDKYVISIDVNSAGQSAPPGGFNADNPLECRLEAPVQGVFVAGQHKMEVTELAVSLSGSVRVASASKDGTVRIWSEKMQCLSMFVPHEIFSVDTVAYLPMPLSTDRHVLLTAGPLNRELKLWAFDELYSKPGQAPCRCIQTLEFQCNGNPEATFYNQVVVAPRAALILVANAKRNAIYAVHMEFGTSSSVYPRMDYLAEFAVTYPILSLTVADDVVTDQAGESSLQVFCVQTQAIQQHTLKMSQCFPLPCDDMQSEGSNPSTPKQAVVSSSSTQMPMANSNANNPRIPPRMPLAFGSMLDLGNRGQNVTTETSKATDTTELTTTEGLGLGKPTIPGAHLTFKAGVQPRHRLNARSTDSAREGYLSSSNLIKPPTPPPRRRSRSRSPAKVSDMHFTPVYPLSWHVPGQHHHHHHHHHVIPKVDGTKEVWVEPEGAMAAPGYSMNYSSSSSSSSSMVEEGFEKEDVNASNPTTSSTHVLVSPSDIMILAAGSKEEEGVQTHQAPEHHDLIDVGDWQRNLRGSRIYETDQVSEEPSHHHHHQDREDDDEPSIPSLLGFFDGQGEAGGEFKDGNPHPHHSRHTSVTIELPELSETDDAQDGDNLLEDRERHMDDSQELGHNLQGIASSASASVPVVAVQPQTSAGFRGRRNKNKNGGNFMSSQFQATPSSGAIAIDSPTVPASPSDPGLIAQVASMQEALNQVVTLQQQMYQKMGGMVSVPVAKEGKRMEGALAQRIEKVLKANVDSVWARLAEENAKREKQDRDRAQQVTNILNTFMTKDVPVALERGLKKEFLALGPTFANSIVPPLHKALSSTVTDIFQKSVIEKVLPQLEKSTAAKLEATVTRQLKTQFQTTGKQALIDAVRLGFESMINPTFERSCRAMTEQIENAFQTGMAEHTTQAQQQLASKNTDLATILEQVVEKASSLARVLEDDLQNSTSKLLELVDSAEARYGEANQSQGHIPEQVHSLQHVEESLDPTIELNRLLQESKMEEAFTKALQSTDLQIVSWLCNQVNPSILSAVPVPLSQGVLLVLVQQLSYNLLKNTANKLQWMKEASLALNPNDPQIKPHLRPYLEQVYKNCHALMGVPEIQAEQADLRLLIHVINSFLSSFK